MADLLKLLGYIVPPALAYLLGKAQAKNTHRLELDRIQSAHRLELELAKRAHLRELRTKYVGEFLGLAYQSLGHLARNQPERGWPTVVLLMELAQQAGLFVDDELAREMLSMVSEYGVTLSSVAGEHPEREDLLEQFKGRFWSLRAKLKAEILDT